MRRNIPMVQADATVQRAAELMRDEQVGFLPVIAGDGSRRLVGVVTDRDIAVRAVAENREPRSTPIGDIVTRQPQAASPDDDLAEVERKMGAAHLHRLPVIGRDGGVMGVVSLFDIAQIEEEARTGRLLRETCADWARTPA